MQQLPESLLPLIQFKQFVLYYTEPDTKRPGKTHKRPCNRDGFNANCHDVKNQLSFEECAKIAKDKNLKVGFVFTKNDPFFFIDIDNALVNNQWNAISQELCATFAGCAIEVSQSMRGLHIIGTGTPLTPSDLRAIKCDTEDFDLYTDNRFCALTGLNTVGSAAFSDNQQRLDGVVTKYLTLNTARSSTGDWTTEPNQQSKPILDDDALIEKALKATSKSDDAAQAFGGDIHSTASFKDLWNNNVEKLAECYPNDQDETKPDLNRCDMAMAQHLAFWTGGQCDRIESLMVKSSLFRDKWSKRPAYLRDTIDKAVTRQKTYYNKGLDTVVVDPIKSMLLEAVVRDGFQIMLLDQMLTHFKGCVYVSSLNKIFTPNGMALKMEQFNAMYGGYVFPLDSSLDKTTTKAWEAFLLSQCAHFPKVDQSCFRPDITVGEAYELEGLRYVNTYVDVNIKQIEGDATPFLNHLAKLLPVQKDRDILMAYMAAVIQHKGYKIQWTPLLQGCEGNGKTLLTRCVAAAIGQRYTHFPKAEKISNQFNSWMENKLFIGVEDIYVPSEKREVIEALKPMITGDNLEIEGKGVDQKTTNICCNFMLNSNHKTAVQKTKNDRRFAVFYTAQQSEEDLKRDGMTGNYFPNLYNWLKNENGYAIVSNYLTTYQIPDELNPTTTLQRAPETSSTTEAIQLGLGVVEQEIMEAVEEGKYGFCHPWISSKMLDSLLKDIRKSGAVPPNKRYELLQSLGYEYHPGLKSGRVNNAIGGMDNGKPRLYIKKGHIMCNIIGGAEIAKAYMDCQSSVIAEAAFSKVI